jgi:toxin FitB
VIVLDTNVLSEVLKPSPSEKVLHWLAAQDNAAVFTTAITLAEIHYGIQVLPPGKRQVRLAEAIDKMFAEEFQGRILPFEDNAARAFAHIVAAREAAGLPISQLDAMIAAIARSHRAPVATRNAADFERCGIRVINPWKDQTAKL